MKLHILYIITDSNRQFLKADITPDINITMNEIKSSSKILFPNGPHLTRIVYMEHFQSNEQAEKRLLQLGQFTRMQKEKLIRKHNANWHNLSLTIVNTPQKKSVVYSS
ncbi:hypothetical protein [Sphingobacterium faecium]|uniref:hypothetical protein n=1 Tax=Sphingobacterium faecium TaxID=34087 RepID=UPI002469A749|nr:hypothetical protein [Sphingobacterium faecium]MDH5827133.1 hypothetical protein [Sphingobacterium faecium]